MYNDKIQESEDIPEDAKNNLNATFRFFREGIEKNLAVCFPACVYSLPDPDTGKIKVMPLVKYAYLKSEVKYIRRQLYEVTLRSLRIGGFQLQMPVFVGDTGWVIAADRDTTLVKQESALTSSILEKDRKEELLEMAYQAEPDHSEIHSFSSGFFIPDNWAKSGNLERCKDFDFEIGTSKDAEVKEHSVFYFGTAIPTAEKGKKKQQVTQPDGTTKPTNVEVQSDDFYEKHNSTSILLKQAEQNATFYLGQSLPKEKEHKAVISLEETKLKYKNENKKEEKSIEAELSDEGINISLKASDTKLSISVTEEGVVIDAGEQSINLSGKEINMTGNVTINGQLSASTILI